MSAEEKLPLVRPAPAQVYCPSCRTNLWARLPIILPLLYVLYYLEIFLWVGQGSSPTSPYGKCSQVEPLIPGHATADLTNMDEYLKSADFRTGTIARLSGAVQIKTQTFDNMGPIGNDTRWNELYKISDYLDSTFPLVHNTLKLEKINVHGLLYTWEGTDPSLKPTVMMAHQDVVPVDGTTENQWTHPGFSGFYDGKYIWGRGSSDDKNALIGVMEAVELLIGAGFKPKRTIILSFGFDEEISGMQGAGHLAHVLIDRYEPTGGAAVILDEGSTIASQWGANFAIVGIAEKGYVDVEIVVRMPGGHSSIPPSHSGIGVASELVTMIEAHPYKSNIFPNHPVLGLVQCAAEHGPSFPTKLKKLLKHKRLAKLAKELGKSSLATKYLFTTSLAVDVINGGVKNNALPERTRVLVNHRVNVGEQTSDVRTKITKLASNVAQKYNLTLHAFSDNETETPASITLSESPNTLEPAPVTPTSVDTVTPYSVLSGTMRALYGDKLFVAPGLMTGNTDTRFYWKLSKHIFRCNPGWDPEDTSGMGNIHTVNERISAVNHIKTVQWYSLFLRNMDEADLA